MGSLILFVLGLAAPFAAAIALMWQEEKRREYLKMRFERMAQDNRGLKLALNANKTAPAAAPTRSERQEVSQLLDQLERNGNLLEWLRLGTRDPAEASAHLLGVTAQEASALHTAIAEWGPHGVVAALDRLKGRLAAVAEMEMVWSDPHAHPEHDASAMIERTLWVFEPEFVLSDGQVAVDPRFGAVAKPSLGASLTPELAAKEGEPALVVELKSARVTVGGDQQLQAWNNVRELIRGGAIRERDPVDVFVVGGAVDEFDGNPRIEGRYRNVRITSFDYGQLITRAKRLTFGLYDELKDAAPFLRGHREAIVAAQQSAAEQAAAEAAAPPPEAEEELRRGEYEADHIRHEEYADAPRRSGFEGDHIVIGQRKNAAQ